jgi:DNA-directed RNA polymerase sigma subunit (sigma70/sigma32)
VADTIVEPSASVDVEDVVFSEAHLRNVRLRTSYLQVQADLDAAHESGDEDVIRQLESRLDLAGAEFIAANRGLAISVASQFRTVNHREDYEAAGLAGLWEAFLKWDPCQGTTFGGFSRRYISGKVQREVRQAEHNVLSYGDFTSRKAVLDAGLVLQRTLGRAPSLDELAEYCKLPKQTVERTLKSRTISLDAPLGGTERGATVGDMIADEPVSPLSDLDGELLDEVLAELSDEELFIVAARAGLLGRDELTYADVAFTVGRDREGVRQVESKALDRIAGRLH